MDFSAKVDWTSKMPSQNCKTGRSNGQSELGFSIHTDPFGSLYRHDLNRPHLAWVALAVKEDTALYPLKILRFSTYAVMLDAQAVTHLVKQFWRQRGLRGGIWHDDFNKTQKFNALQTRYLLYTPSPS